MPEPIPHTGQEAVAGVVRGGDGLASSPVPQPVPQPAQAGVGDADSPGGFAETISINTPSPGPVARRVSAGQVENLPGPMPQPASIQADLHLATGDEPYGGDEIGPVPQPARQTPEDPDEEEPVQM